MGQIQETADNLAMLRSSGVPEAQISGYGGRLSADEAQGILSKYNATKATGADVFTPGNVAQTLTNPIAPYDYSDPLKLQERVRTDLGLPDVEKQYQEAIANLRSFDTGTTNQQFGIEQELNPMGVIRGEQATALGQRSLSRQGFADTAQTLADRYNALMSEATNKFNILNTERSNLQQLMINNPGAGITYTDTIDKATQKLENYRVQQEKIAEKKAEEVQKKAYKNNLKSTALQLGIKTSGSTKEIEKRLKKYYGSQAEYNKKIQDLELQAKRQSLSSSGAANVYSKIDSAFNKNNGNWDATVAELSKTMDVSEGSVVDNELRRRNGLAPIAAAGESVANTNTLQNQIDLVKASLGNAQKLSGASGRSGIRKTVESLFVGSTDYTDLVAETNTLRTNFLTMMTDPSIKKFFGPQMSNADVQLMTSAGTTLNPEMQSPEKMKSELSRMKDLVDRAERAIAVGVNQERITNQPDTYSAQTPFDFNGQTYPAGTLLRRGSDGTYYPM